MVERKKRREEYGEPERGGTITHYSFGLTLSMRLNTFLHKLGNSRGVAVEAREVEGAGKAVEQLEEEGDFEGGEFE